MPDGPEVKKRKRKPKGAEKPPPARPDAYRERQAALSRAASSARREIGAIPDILDIDRRERCQDSLKLFCDTYNPALFYRPWSDDQLRSVGRLEEAARQGAMYAFAEPRGSGKSSRVRMAALWAFAYRHVRYPFVIGANATKADEALTALKLFVRFLPAFGEDFPEIVWPVACLGGIANRAGGQTCGGYPTLIEWSKDRIVLPTVPPPANWPKRWPLRADGMVPTSGSAVGVSGLTGEGIRGSLLTLSTGESIRPDLVLLDDPQTDESAASPIGNERREELVSGAVLGMAGPGMPLAAVMPCTVIKPGDFVDRLLDRSKHPLWRGERSGIFRSMPADLAAWDDYFAVYARCALKEPPDFAEANAHYLAHRAVLDAGAVASWEARKLDTEVSAVQHAMHLFFRDRRAFWAEYMNQPQAADLTAGAKELHPNLVTGRLSGTERYAVPAEATRLTAFFDMSRFVVWHMVVAFDESFGGAVIDYGCSPGQARPVFRQADAHPSLASQNPGLSDAQLAHLGLTAAAAAVLGRTYRKPGGTELSVSRALADCGWEKDAVVKAVRASPFRATLFPSSGQGRTLTKVSVGKWNRREGEQRGYEWKLTAGHDGRGRQAVFDADSWKSFAHARLTTGEGGHGAVLLYGSAAAGRRPDHSLLGQHFAAERSEPKKAHGEWFDKWEQRPGHENHWLDCFVGCCVAASVDGLVFHPGGTPAPRPRPAAGPSMADRVRDRQAARNPFA